MNLKIFDNVLFIAPHYRFWKGGISSVVIEYKNAIKNFHFLPSTTLSNLYITTLTFPFLILAFVLRLVIRRKIKIIHIHGASRGSFYRKFIFFFIAKKLFGKKVVYHIHGGGYHLFYQGAAPLVRRCITYMIKESDTLIVLSESWKTFFEKEFSPQKIKIVPNIVGNPHDSEKNPLNKSNTLKQFDQNKIVNLLFLGKIGDNKGIFDLLSLLAENSDYFETRCHLKVGGDGEVDRLLEFISTNNLSGLVEYVGFVGGDKKISILEETDLYILPSYNEGLPISILEAMSFSKPIISTRVGGIPEIINDGYNGILFEPGDKVGMMNALKTLIEDKDKIKLYGERSYKFVRDNHFPKPVLKNLIELYEDIL